MSADEPIDATEGLLVRIDAEDQVMMVRIGPAQKFPGKENMPFQGVWWVGTESAWRRRNERETA